MNSLASISSYQLIAFMLTNPIKLITHHQGEFRRDCPGCMFSVFYGCLFDMDTGDNVVHVWPQQNHQLPVVLKSHGCTWSFPVTQYLSMSTFPHFMPLSPLFFSTLAYSNGIKHTTNANALDIIPLSLSLLMGCGHCVRVNIYLRCSVKHLRAESTNRKYLKTSLDFDPTGQGFFFFFNYHLNPIDRRSTVMSQR